MEKERNEITDILLNAALEIIYLLTGEDYTVVKKTSGDCMTPIIHLQESGGWSRAPGSITEPPPHLLSNKEKILDLTKKMTELLTGEDLAIHLSVEKTEYTDEHQDLYKDVAMEDPQPLASSAGSSRRNPPERRPRPLYSRDPPEEDPNVQENQQGENLMDIKNEVKDEADETDIKARRQYQHKKRNPPKRRPRRLYSQHPPEEDPNVPETQQEEDLTIIKVELEEWMIGDDLCKSEEEEEEETMGNRPCRSKAEKIPVHGTAENRLEGNYTSPVNDEVEDDVLPQLSSGENRITPDVHPRVHNADLFYNLQLYSCSKCGKTFVWKSDLVTHERSHTRQKPHSCTECGKSFTEKALLVAHERVHTGEKPYSCPECGKCFNRKSSLLTHKRIHTGVKSYSCSECGKSFTQKASLVYHEESHTGAKPYSCSSCEKCFNRKSNLVRHERIHTGEKPYLCSECGKCFISKAHLNSHQRRHTGGKSF